MNKIGYEIAHGYFVDCNLDQLLVQIVKVIAWHLQF